MTQAMTDTWMAQVLEEHRELRELTAKIRSIVEVPRPPTSSPDCHRWSADLVKGMVDLHDRLVRHFAYEEEGGMAEELTLAHPSASDRIANVLGEHPEILGAARQITGDLLHYSEGEDPADPHLRRRITELLDHLAEHERNETDLIQRLEYRELGVGD